MRRLLLYVLAFVCLGLSLYSCQKAPFITLSTPRSFTFTRDGGTQSISFTCNRDWSISSSESWIQVSSASGTVSDGEVTVKITCAANTTYDPRSATIIVKVEELTEAISISQETGIGLLVSPKTFDLTNAAQDIEIVVQKNVQYTVAIDNESAKWIKQGGTKALTTDKITFSITANDSYDNREGRIVFKQLDGNLTEAVTIRQSQQDGLFVSPQTFELGYEAQVIEVETKYNVAFDVSIPDTADWISMIEGTKALSTGKTQFSIQANETFETRKAIISFKQKNGDLSASVLVKQAGRIAVESIVLDKANLTLVEGTSEKLVATVKPDDATDKTVSWRSSNTNIATVNENGIVSAQMEGSTTIIAMAGEKQASCSVVVERDKTKATSLSMDGGALFICPGDSYNLEVSVTPEDAICDFVWEVSYSNLIVSGNGASATVSALSSTTGYTTVTVRDRRTSLSASVSVYTYIADLTWNVTSEETYFGYPLITLPVGGTYQLEYTSSAGSNVRNLFNNQTDFIYYENEHVVDEPSFISLSPDGVVTGIKEGVTGFKTTGYITSSGKRVYFKVASSIYESEYNDTMEYANYVPYGVAMTFDFMNITDVDWFKLQTPASYGYMNARITVEFPDAVTLPEKQVRMCKYSIYDSGMYLWGAGSFNFSSTETAASTLRAIPAGPIYIKVYFDTSYSSILLPMGSLKLSISVEEF